MYKVEAIVSLSEECKWICGCLGINIYIISICAYSARNMGRLQVNDQEKMSRFTFLQPIIHILNLMTNFANVLLLYKNMHVLI